MAENKNIPDIRFIGFTDPWEQREFDEVFTSFANKNYQVQSTEYCESGKYPIIDQGKKTIIGYSDNKDKVCNKYPSVIFGDHTTEIKYVDFPFIIGADGVKTLSVKDGDTLFQYYNLQVNNVQPTGYNRHFSMLKEISLNVPTLAEQQLIGTYFHDLDNLITLHQRKYEKLKQIKRSMLEKMFPRDGSNVPEIRFDGFTEPWKQRKFSELYEKNTEKNAELIAYDKTISIATMTYKNDGNGASDSSLSGYKVLRIGDIAFEGHTSKEFSYGRFVVNDIGVGLMSPRFSTLRPVSNMPVDFWKYYIHYEPIMRNVLVNVTKAGTMMNELVISEFLEQTILVPSVVEQQKIGDYFSNLDNLIALHQRKYEKLKQIKKSMLEKMFV